MSSFFKTSRAFCRRSSTVMLSRTSWSSWTSPLETAAVKSASLSGSSNTLDATWLMEKLVIWSRKRGLSWAISLKMDTISETTAQMYWLFSLYGSCRGCLKCYLRFHGLLIKCFGLGDWMILA